MANQTSGNPVVIDTFGSDVVIRANKVTVSSIVVDATAAAEIATFIDRDGNEVLRIAPISGSSITWSPAEPFTFNGLTFDDSGSSVGVGDFVYIYIK